jgi:hypothetical protein
VRQVRHEDHRGSVVIEHERLPRMQVRDQHRITLQGSAPGSDLDVGGAVRAPAGDEAEILGPVGLPDVDGEPGVGRPVLA